MPTTINDELLRIEQAKADIATAIGGKGVTVPANAKIDDFADLIDAIQTGGGGTDDTLLGIMNKTITSVDIPNSVTSIANSFFVSCRELETVTFPITVTSLGNDCFNSCQSLVEVCLPENVTSIGIRCFAFCSSLGKVVIMATNPPSLGANAFASTKIASNNGSIYVPMASVNDYKNATDWSSYANQIKGWKYDANNNIVDENDNIIINAS